MHHEDFRPEHKQEFNTFTPLKNADPFPLYAYAREQEPLFWSDVLGCWIVTTWQLVKRIARNEDEVFSSKDALHPTSPLSDRAVQVLYHEGFGFRPTVLTADGEKHRQLRATLQKALRPAKIWGMEEDLRTIANVLIDRFQAQGRADLITQFAVPFPLEAILKLFDIPKQDLARCKQWSDDVHYLTASPHLTEEQQLHCMRSFAEFQHYFASLVRQRKEAPGQDVVSTLAATMEGDESDEEQVKDLANTLLGVLIAGHQTTTCFIGNALSLLLRGSRIQKRSLWQELGEKPSDLVPILEEVLRFESPVQGFYRTALRDVMVEGVQIHAGQRLLLMYGSANRDAPHCRNAENFDAHRIPKPSEHLAFGSGAHFCLGATLARLEGRIALEVLLQRLPELCIETDQSRTHISSLNFRGWEKLECVWIL